MKRLAVAIAIIAGFLPTSLSADEPAQVFLDALRDNGYFDVAIDYLEGLEGSDLISPEFKSGLPFELAQTMIASTANLRDFELVESRLDEAQTILTEYAANNQSLEVSARTLRYQGNLFFRRSNIYLGQSESDRLTAAEKDELLGKARLNLQGALENYQKAKDQIRKLIDPNSPDAILIDPADPSTLRRRNRYQGNYTQVRVSIPKVTEQLADTYAAGSAQRQELLVSARDEYRKVWDAYPKYLAGLNSCVYAARCSHKLGEPKVALDLLSEIFALGNNSVLKPVKLEAYMLASECWHEIQPYPYNEVVMRLEPAVTALNQLEVRTPEWGRVQLEYAVAKYAQAGEVKSKGGPKANSDSKQMERAAAKVLRNVARVPGPLRERANGLLAEWDVKIADVPANDTQPPASFVDAHQKGKDLVSVLEATVGEAAALKAQLRTAPVDQQPALKQQHQALMEQVTAESQGALELFDLALSLVDDATLRADINNVRYLQCYCYFVSERYIEAAIIGEFLLTRYPTVDGTRQAMSLLIQSYSILMDRADDGDKEYEEKRLIATCDEVLRRWPGSREAGAAASTMTRLMLNLKQFDLARKYFDQIPTDASYRPAIGMRLGQRMWFDYKSKMNAESNDEAAMKSQLGDAVKFMAEGVNEVNPDQLNYDTALAALLLVDARIQSGDVERAIARLETDPIAPLDLLKLQHPAITQTPMAGVYRREVYKTAIKAYLAAMDSGADQQKWVDKAAGIINTMRDELKVSNDPKDRQQVAQIYQRIAKELKENFQALTDPAKKKKFAASLANFLGSIEKESEDAKIVLWAGSTLLGVAESLSQSGFDDDARAMFAQAANALTRAESMGFKGDPQEDAMVMELKRQRALAQRGSGQYEQAVAQFVEILKESPNALGVQMDVAETLQVWASVNGGPKRYIEAVKGGEPYKDPKTKRSKKRIWGWETIALATRSKASLRDTFYEALYHVVECRLEYGIMTKNVAAIKAAGNEIAKERKRDPTFNGSEKWKQKFEAIEIRVNEAKQ